jgi:hypothetical protein
MNIFNFHVVEHDGRIFLMHGEQCLRFKEIEFDDFALSDMQKAKQKYIRTSFAHASHYLTDLGSRNPAALQACLKWLTENTEAEYSFVGGEGYYHLILRRPDIYLQQHLIMVLTPQGYKSIWAGPLRSWDSDKCDLELGELVLKNFVKLQQQLHPIRHERQIVFLIKQVNFSVPNDMIFRAIDRIGNHPQYLDPNCPVMDLLRKMTPGCSN